MSTSQGDHLIKGTFGSFPHHKAISPPCHEEGALGKVLGDLVDMLFLFKLGRH